MKSIKALLKSIVVPSSAPDIKDLFASNGADPQVFATNVAQALTTHVIQSHQEERRWIRLRRLGLILMFTMGFLSFLYKLGGSQKLGVATNGPTIATIDIKGDIMAGQRASADAIIPALKAAHKDANVKAIVLRVDSGGGAPVEAERVVMVMDQLRKADASKKIIAVCENMTGSAAYMIAMAADQVVAGRYSLVGSIGVIMTSWDSADALERLSIRQHVYASGPLKSMLNPYSKPSPEAQEVANEMVRSAGKSFAADLAKRRGSHIKDLAYVTTGRVWSGEEALALGLVDRIGSIETEALAIDPDAKVKDFGPHVPMPFWPAALNGAVSTAMDAARAQLGGPGFK